MGTDEVAEILRRDMGDHEEQWRSDSLEVGITGKYFFGRNSLVCIETRQLMYWRCVMKYSG